MLVDVFAITRTTLPRPCARRPESLAAVEDLGHVASRVVAVCAWWIAARLTHLR